MSEPVHTSETPASGPQLTADVESYVKGMSAATAAETSPTPPEGAGKPDQPEVFDKTYVEKLRRENASYRTKAQENADAAKRLKEIEDRDLSELQKAQRDREEALTRLQAIEREALRNRVALNKGLPAEIAATLNGSSEDELAAHADALIAWRGNVPPTTPRPDPGQGPRPTTPESEAEADYYRFFPDEAPRRA